MTVCVCVCPPQSPSHKNKRQQQELIQELRRKQVKDSRHVYEGKDGAIEDIITGNISGAWLQSLNTHTHKITLSVSCMRVFSAATHSVIQSSTRRDSKPTNTTTLALFKLHCQMFEKQRYNLMSPNMNVSDDHCLS